jgi:hypothetical protein
MAHPLTVRIAGVLSLIWLSMGCNRMPDAVGPPAAIPSMASAAAPTAVTAASKPAFAIVDENGIPYWTDQQILSYNWTTHSITFRSDADVKGRDSDIPNLVSGVPFSVTANGVTCYRGVLTSSSSSNSQTCTVIDISPWKPKPRVLQIELGYPTPDAFQGVDPRGDERVRSSLIALGKLVEDKPEVGTKNHN